jgi:hypothetical protein
MNNLDPRIINNNQNNDAHVLETYLNLIDKDNKTYIDIGSSNHYNLNYDRIEKSEQTIFFECDTTKSSFYDKWDLKNFDLVTKKVTPDNIVEEIQRVTDNTNPKLVDIDIDGYDFFVLKALLEKISPSLLVAEINEKIPPPIKFTVNYWPEYWFADVNRYGTVDDSHFYGMSLSKFYELANEYGYDVINLTFNNVYAVRKNKNPGLETFEESKLYDTFYKNPRLTGAAPMFYYNSNMDPLLRLSPDEGVKFLRSHYESRGYGDPDGDFYDLYL